MPRDGASPRPLCMTGSHFAGLSTDIAANTRFLAEADIRWMLGELRSWPPNQRRRRKSNQDFVPHFFSFHERVSDGQRFSGRLILTALTHDVKCSLSGQTYAIQST
jgi:hypothetical protein